MAISLNKWSPGALVLSFIIAAFAAAGSSEHPAPIAHWKLDDTGDVARDSAGSHHGKIHGAKPTVPCTLLERTGYAPENKGSMQFVRKQGNYIEIPWSEDFAISTFTVSAWVFPSIAPTFSGILGTRHGGEYTFDMKVNADKVHGDIGDGKKWIETKVNFYADDTGTNGQGGDLEILRWYHIVYVIDNETKQCRLYLDGDLKKSINFKGNPILMTPETTMHIGHSSGNEFMDGRIDDVKIWNLALTTEQVVKESKP